MALARQGARVVLGCRSTTKVNIIRLKVLTHHLGATCRSARYPTANFLGVCVPCIHSSVHHHRSQGEQSSDGLLFKVQLKTKERSTNRFTPLVFSITTLSLPRVGMYSSVIGAGRSGVRGYPKKCARRGSRDSPAGLGELRQRARVREAIPRNRSSAPCPHQQCWCVCSALSDVQRFLFMLRRALFRGTPVAHSQQGNNDSAQDVWMKLPLVFFFSQDVRDIHVPWGVYEEVLDNKIRVFSIFAGLLVKKPEVVQGMEKTVVINQLGPFLLTNLLLPDLQKSTGELSQTSSAAAAAASRIVNVSSRLEKNGSLPAMEAEVPPGKAWFHPPAEGEYGMWKQYGTSKLCNLLFTFELNRRLVAAQNSSHGGAKGGVIANAVTPGVVNSDLGRSVAAPWMFWAMKPLLSLIMRTVDKGAETVVWAASSPEVEGSGGKFFMDLKEMECSETSKDDELAKKLWEACEIATGLEEDERIV